MTENEVKVGDKIVYDNGHRKDYITVKEIKDFEGHPVGEPEKKSMTPMINGKYAFGDYLRPPMKWEVENGLFDH